ncbi:MAG: hypothetical protein OXG56_11225 [Gammaproteobacteria bacterium]|nr:hypothetical protein [Gammaproteobacteria bacterium]
MSAPLFDTRDAAEDLEAAGFEPKQAKAIVQIVDKSLTGGVVTKADLAEVKAELEKAIQGQTIKLGGLMIALAAALKFFPGGGPP